MLKSVDTTPLMLIPTPSEIEAVHSQPMSVSSRARKLGIVHDLVILRDASLDFVQLSVQVSVNSLSVSFLYSHTVSSVSAELI
jgi:hypothetical protein